MARFDYHWADGELLVDCQSDQFRHLTTRVVAPLYPAGDVPTDLKRLHPIVEVRGEKMLLAAHLLTAVPVKELGPPIGNLNAYEYQISGALDLLLTGV